MKRILQNTLLCSLSIVMVCLVIEITLRLAGYNPFWELLEDPSGSHLVLRPSAFEGRMYEATPNSNAFAWSTPVSINSYGFRDKEYALQKAGAYRIIVLGDSIAFGNFLPDVQDTFVKQLEEIFAKAPLTQKVEVLN